MQDFHSSNPVLLSFCYNKNKYYTFKNNVDFPVCITRRGQGQGRAVILGIYLANWKESEADRKAPTQREEDVLDE